MNATPSPPVRDRMQPQHWAQLKSILLQHVPEATVLVFGSYARGEQRADSDLDLAILMPDTQMIPVARQNDLRDALVASGLPIRVDLVDWHLASAALRAQIQERYVTLQPEFFISYTQADRQWAQWIAFTLEQAGHSTRIQAWDFRAGSNIAVAIDTALRYARHVMPILSSQYLLGDWCRVESLTAIFNDPLGQRRRVMPVRVAPCTLEGLLAPISYIDLVGYGREDAITRLQEGIKLERARPEQEPIFPGTVEASASALAARSVAGRAPAFPGDLPRIWGSVPQRSEAFAHRESELAAMEQTLQTYDRLAITGATGIGKSSLAAEYIHRHHTQFDAVFWLTVDPEAESKDDMRRAFVATVCRSARLEAAPEAQAEQAERWFASHSHWLIVIDNAPSHSALDWLPATARPGHGKLIVTSLQGNWDSGFWRSLRLECALAISLTG